jgi:hypothetical protein
LDEARGRIKKEKYRLVVIDQPGEPDLPAAVRAGIHDTVALYTEKPPRGSASNWGFKAYDRWIGALRKPLTATGWLSAFETPRKRFAALSSAYRYALTFWEDDTLSADRNLYAQFLDEAAEAGLPSSEGAPALREAADVFRSSGLLWREFGEALLPEAVAALGEARDAIAKRHATFLESGKTDSLSELDERYNAARDGANTDDALGDDEMLAEVLTNAASVLEQIRDHERSAVDLLVRAIE